MSLAIQKQVIMGDAPEVISLGVGGNDIGFMDKLKACIMPDTCEWVGEERRRDEGGEEHRRTEARGDRHRGIRWGVTRATR